MAKTHIKSIQTVSEIVNALLELETAGVTEVATFLGIPISTTYEHLETLVNHGYAHKTSDGYSLSMRFLQIGSRRRKQTEIYQASVHEVHKLAERTKAHAGVVIEEGGRGTMLEIAKSIDAPDLPFDEYPGMRMQLHATASGKAILAHIDEARVAEIVEQYGLPAMTKNTISNHIDLESDLEMIRDQGYAISREESIEGLYSIASPVVDDDDELRGAICVYGPIGRLKESRIEEIAELVIQTANVSEMHINHMIPD